MLQKCYLPHKVFIGSKHGPLSQEMILLWGKFQEFLGRRASERPEEIPVLAPWSHGSCPLRVVAGCEKQPGPPFWLWGGFGKLRKSPRLDKLCS